MNYEVSETATKDRESTLIETIISESNGQNDRIRLVIQYLKSLDQGLNTLANRINPDNFPKNFPADGCAGSAAAPNSMPPVGFSGLSLELKASQWEREALINEVFALLIGPVDLTVNFLSKQI